MNKFTELLNESQDFDQIQNSIIPLMDLLGRPEVATINYGEKSGYIFKWNLGFSILQYNGFSELEKISQIFESMKDLNQSINSIMNYDIDFKIEENLFVRITPKTVLESDSYNFIVGQNWRNIIVDYSKVSKFFKDHGYVIKNTKNEDSVYEQKTSIHILTDAPNYVTKQFEDLINSEIEHLYNIEETLNRKITCTTNGGMVYIFPEDEKTFVVFNQEL
jgi:hypothetical protein